MEQWRGNVFKATWSLPQDLNQAPRLEIIPEFVFGYQSKETRNNLKYINDYSIIYPAGAIIIMTDTIKNTQKHFIKSKDVIQAFSIHKEKKLIAAGEILKNKSTKNTILTVWNYENMEEIMSLENVSIKGLVSIAFNIIGTHLVCIGNDEEHTVSIVDLIKKSVVCSSNGSKNKILDSTFRTNMVLFWLINRNSPQ